MWSVPAFVPLVRLAAALLWDFETVGLGDFPVTVTARTAAEVTPGNRDQIEKRDTH
jgi:hypothetical protein